MTNPENPEWKVAFSIDFDDELGIAYTALARKILYGLKDHCPVTSYRLKERSIVTAFLVKATTHDEAVKEAFRMFSSVIDLPSTLGLVDRCDDISDEVSKKRLASRAEPLPRVMPIPEALEQPEPAVVMQLFNGSNQ